MLVSVGRGIFEMSISGLLSPTSRFQSVFEPQMALLRQAARTKTNALALPTDAVFKKLGITDEEGKQNISKALDGISFIETNMQDIPNAKGSSARGFFQHMVNNGDPAEGSRWKGSSFEVALNRVDSFYKDNNLGEVPESFKEARRLRTPMGVLNYDEQKMLTFIDKYTRTNEASGGTSALFKQIAKGGNAGQIASRNLYTDHHLISKKQAKDIQEKINNQFPIIPIPKPRPNGQ